MGGGKRLEGQVRRFRQEDRGNELQENDDMKRLHGVRPPIYIVYDEQWLYHC